MIRDQKGEIVAEGVDVQEWLKDRPNVLVVYYFRSINRAIIYR